MEEKDELFALIHDTMGPTKRIRELVKMLVESNELSKDNLKLCEFIVTSSKELDAGVDRYYISQRDKNISTKKS